MFQVFTQDKDRGVAQAIAAHHLEGFTVLYGIGCWRGTFERSQVFHVETADRAAVYSFAQDLKAALAQSAVLVVETDSTGVLI